MERDNHPDTGESGASYDKAIQNWTYGSPTVTGRSGKHSPGNIRKAKSCITIVPKKIGENQPVSPIWEPISSTHLTLVKEKSFNQASRKTGDEQIPRLDGKKGEKQARTENGFQKGGYYNGPSRREGQESPNVEFQDHSFNKTIPAVNILMSTPTHQAHSTTVQQCRQPSPSKPSD